MLFCRTCRYNGIAICCFVERVNTMVCTYVVLQNVYIQWYVHMLFCRTCKYNGMSICCFVERVNTMVCTYVVLQNVQIQWYVHMLFCRTCRYYGTAMSTCCFRTRGQNGMSIMLICTTRGYNGMSICCFVQRVDTILCPLC